MIALFVCLVGLASLAVGVWLIYPPASFVVVGVVLLAAGLLYVRGGRAA